MAIKNLRCIREDDGVAVIWAWDMDQKYAVITVARLLDGEEVASKKVEGPGSSSAGHRQGR